MDVRITQQQSMHEAVRLGQLRQQAIADLQNQLATGLRISKPSDSPADWSSLTANKNSIERMNVDLENIATARQRLNQSVSTLTEAGNLLVRAREIAISGPQSQDRSVLATEVNRLIEAMLSIANSTESESQLYSGTASYSKPFVVTEVDEQGRPLEIQYNGASTNSEVIVGRGTASIVLSPGAQVFQQRDRGSSQYIGPTGAVQGSGTDNARGVGSLTVRHTSTAYSSAIVAPGVSSVAGDTIVGPLGAHKLRIDNDPSLGRVVRLNSGGPVSFDASSTDLEVVGPEGEKVFVDLSAVPIGFVGELDITSDGTLSVDGGTTEVPVDFSSSQIVTHASTGSVTVVDSSAVRRTGTDRIEYSGTAGVFESLMQLRDDLLNADNLSTTDFVSVMDARLSDVIRAHSQVIEFVGEQSVELANLETLETRTRELRLVTQEAVIDLENADIADVIVRLQTEETHLQYIYASTAMMFQTSLLDFIA